MALIALQSLYIILHQLKHYPKIGEVQVHFPFCLTELTPSLPSDLPSRLPTPPACRGSSCLQSYWVLQKRMHNWPSKREKVKIVMTLFTDRRRHTGKDSSGSRRCCEGCLFRILPNDFFKWLPWSYWVNISLSDNSIARCSGKILFYFNETYYKCQHIND